MTDQNLKDHQPDDTEPTVPNVKDVSTYPGNHAGTVQSTPALNEGDAKRKEGDPDA